MNTYKINTIDIQAKEWIDRKNANSYFSAVVTLNFGLDSEKSFNIPFQYGYEFQYISAAFRLLQIEEYIPVNYNVLWKYCEDQNIEVRTSKKKNCLKSEVKNFVKY